MSIFTADCPPGYSQTRLITCLSPQVEPVSWPAAQETCTQGGGNIASVTGDKALDVLKEEAERAGIVGDYVWTSYTDNRLEGKWVTSILLAGEFSQHL